MALRCLLFTSDEGTAQSVRQALTELSVESEHCTIALDAVQKVTNDPLNLLIVDWDNQTDAAFLLKNARERKASERPLTVAIVSSDPHVSQALQAGANSILRKPIVVAQIRDSLTSARNLLRSRQDASLASAQAATAGPPATAAALPGGSAASKKPLRAREFMQPTSAPGAQFVTEADVQSNIQKTMEQAEVAKVDLLKELEPVAAAVDPNEVPSPPPLSGDSGEPRGLAWYLKAKARAATSQPPAPSSSAPAKPELVGYAQMSSTGAAPETTVPSRSPATPREAANPTSSLRAESDKNAESALFAYMSGESSSDSKPPIAKSPSWLRRAILGGALVAVFTVAFITVPSERWRQNFQLVASSAAHFAHNWLNPQASTLTQVPAAHENFGLAGDEYKLPVAQNIPDATTDPTQIRVVPIVDPTAKQPNGASNAVSGAEDSAAAESPNESPTDQPAPPVRVQETAQPASSGPVTGDVPPSSAPSTPHTVAVEPRPATTPEPAPATARHDPMLPPPVSKPRPQPVSVASSFKPPAGIPSSLKSQMAPATPDAGGNKPVEAAMPSIEPVAVPEATARGLLLQQPEPEYPATAKGQHGSVTLQVLIGRDGSVQDAKFLQGSLAFARSAIDGVKQWRFKPYNLNGHPVSIQTVLTLSFKPTS